MKKYLLITLSFLLALTAIGCDKDVQDAPTDPPHEHSYSLKQTVDATCTAAGQKIFECSCGDSYSEPIEKLEHTFGEWTVTTNPTLTATGTETRTCSVCGEAENKEIPKLTTEDVLAGYAEILLDLPTFNTTEELSAGPMMNWVLMNVNTISNEWSDVTFLVTKVYSLDEINRMTTHYFGKTFDFTYIVANDESLTLNQQDKTLTWVIGGMGGWPNYAADTITKIDDTHYTMRYAVTDLGEEKPFLYGNLTLTLVDGRFIISSHTVEQ